MTDAEKLYRADYIVFFPDGSARSGFVQWPRNPGLKLIKELVLPALGEGEPLEHVAVLYKGRRADMFVSELGHLNLIEDPIPDRPSRLPLPRNNAATDIYRANWLDEHPKDDPESLPWIAGPAILFTNRIVWT